MGDSRLQCIVPFCRRTARADHFPPGYTIICQKHWRLVPQPLKREHRRWERMARKAISRGLCTPRIHTRAFSAWSACKAAAIEAAMGVG